MRRLPVVLPVTLVALMAPLAVGGPPPVLPPLPAFKPPSKKTPTHLYVIDKNALSPAETVVAQTLQGIVAQTVPEVWIANGNSSLWLDELKTRHGVKTTPVKLWDLVDLEKPKLKGYVLYDLGTDSLNVATSLSGVLGAIAVDTGKEAVAKAHGLAKVADVRGGDERWLMKAAWPSFNRDVLLEQMEAAPFQGFLRDLAAYQRAFTYFDGDSSLRTDAARASSRGARVFGWGGNSSETPFFRGVSRGGAAPVVANTSQNLSVLMQMPSVAQTQTHPKVGATDPTAHYVAFVMTDGDNVQWFQTAFMNRNWWGNANRGKFHMGWELNPILAEVAPTILEHYYREAARAPFRDEFVCSPSGYGTIFPSDYPDMQGYAAKLAPLLQKADQRVVSVLDEKGDMKCADAFLARPEVLGVIFKDQNSSGYAGHKGQVRWLQGKPTVAYRYLIWDDKTAAHTPEGVAAALNGAARNPTKDAKSYSLVNVHAWSYWGQDVNGTGCMDGVARCVAKLAPHVTVVTPEELLIHLRNNLGAPVSAPAPTTPAPTTPTPTTPAASKTFEAEKDLSHLVGRKDQDGWSCNVAQDKAGFLAYGPYVSGVAPGPLTARFRVLVDNNSADDLPVLTLDVRDAASGKLLAQRVVRRKELAQPFAYQDLAVPFVNPAGSKLEVRTFWHGIAYVREDRVRLGP